MCYGLVLAPFLEVGQNPEGRNVKLTHGVDANRCTDTVQIAKALSESKRTFLEQPDWQTIPWALATTSKSHQNGIFDILSFVPGLFEDLRSSQIIHATA